MVDRYLGGPLTPNRVMAGVQIAQAVDEDIHSLRHEAEKARTVTPGDQFFSAPGAKR